MSISTQEAETSRAQVSQQEQQSFFKVLNQRVNQYFKESNKTKFGNNEMIFKTIFMFMLLFVPYTLILMDIFNAWGLMLLAVIMGLGTSGVGLAVMHDANHGSLSRYKWINKILGYSINIIGGNATNWKIQHNVLHHTYTNVEGHDEDIASKGIFRFTPHTKRKKIHRYQHIYAWFLYGLMTIGWAIVKDFRQLYKYTRDGLVKKQKLKPFNAWMWLTATKVLYFGYILVIPMLVTSYAWWQLLISFFLMHYVTGFILGIIFQPAHVVEGTEFPLPDEDGKLENQWAAHQLFTTMNFANRSRIFTWLIGGLNFQVEHHLFPHICHIHYRKISVIVRNTASEYNLPYLSQPTFVHALYNHLKLLRKLGRA
ncbi:MAG: acyl-CoA desaturase [Bacteroidota bacterium]